MTQFQTARLTVRLMGTGDAARVASYRSDPRVARYVPWAPPYTRARASDMIARTRGCDFDNPGPTGLIMAVERNDDGTQIGDAMIKHDREDPRQGVIGYVVAHEHQGLGYATELAHGLIRRFFASPVAHRVAATCDLRNTGSANVLEKVGMRREAMFMKGVFEKGEWVDECVYALLRAEWESRECTS